MIPLDGKDGLFEEVADLFEDVEGDIAAGKDKIEFGCFLVKFSQCLFSAFLIFLESTFSFHQWVATYKLINIYGFA